MAKVFWATLIGWSLTIGVQAQQTATVYAEEIAGVRLGNHSTTGMLRPGQTAVNMVHYFGKISENGVSDLFGIYGTANIQMGLEHGLGTNTSAFLSSEKINKTQELGIRYRFLRQDMDNDRPISAAAAFSVSIDARNEKYFGDNYRFFDRFFYTTQLSVSRQMNYRTSLMANLTVVHFNIVPENFYSTFLAASPSVSYKLNRKTALFATFDFPLGIASASGQQPESTKPIVMMGTILRTPSHNFQFFVGNGYHISPGKDYLNNHTGFAPKELRIGFNMQVLIGNRHKPQ
ncbi:MAG: DUF5777 family beta-barrel protein [Breznakibacter sp.]